MYCGKCGKENLDSARFCRYCGTPLSDITVSDGAGTEEMFCAPEDTEEGMISPKPGSEKKRNRAFLLAACAVIALGVAVMVFLALTDIRKEKKIERNLEAGLRFLEEEDYEKAAASFREAISIDPKRIELYRGAAGAYIALKDDKSTKEIYNAAFDVIVAEYEESKEILEDSEEIYGDAIIYYGKQGDPGKVEELFREICAMTSDEEKKAEIEELEQQYGTNKAYYDLLVQYREKHGEGTKYSAAQYMDYLTGLCMAKLVDFDKDGRNELLLAYADETSYDRMYMFPRYVVEVWKESEDEIRKVFEGKGYGNDGATSTLYLACIEEQYYIIEGMADDFEYDDIWGFQGEEFVKVKELRSEPEIWEGYSYQIDGRSVTMEEFQQESQKWWFSKTTYGLSRGNGEQEYDRSLSELAQTFQYLKEKIKIKESDESTRMEEVSPQTYQAVYGPILQNIYNTYGRYNDYYVYDIDKDGVKELLAEEGRSEADYVYQIYTIRDQASVRLGEVNGGHVGGFYAGEGAGGEAYIIKLGAQMGYEWVTHIRIRNGSVEEEEISNRNADVYGHTEISGSPLEWRYADDWSLLK